MAKTHKLELAQARAEYESLSEAEVWQEMDEKPDDSVAAEVTRLAVDFFMQFRAYMRVRELLRLPPQVMHVCARCPIERVAVIIMVGYMRAETGVPPLVTVH